jgi:hypothetical protein
MKKYKICQKAERILKAQMKPVCIRQDGTGNPDKNDKQDTTTANP